MESQDLRISDFETRYQERVPRIQGLRNAYAVLIPLIEFNGEINLLFEVRASSLKRQPGEICFPGGRIESKETIIECALRETREELGVPSEEIQILGQADYLYSASGAAIFPVLGSLSKEGFAALALNPAEVESTFLVPFSRFQEEAPLVYHYNLAPRIPEDFPYDLLGIDESYHWRSGGQVEVPIFNVEDHVIWGITGRILLGLLKEMGKRE